MTTTILRDDDYVYSDATILPPETPREELDRLASDLAVYDRARVAGQRVAPATVPDESLDLWWAAQVSAAHRSGIVVALRARPLRQAWAPHWGAAIVRPDDMDMSRGVVVGVRVLAHADLSASWSPGRDPEAVLRDMASAWRPGSAR